MFIYIIARECNLTVIVTVSSDIHCLKRNFLKDYLYISILVNYNYFVILLKQIFNNIFTIKNIRNYLLKIHFTNLKIIS